MRDIREGTGTLEKSPAKPEYGILGPTFSGSLYSLSSILQEDEEKGTRAPAYDQGRTLPVYATVMTTKSIKDFSLTEPSHVRIRMTLFQEDADKILGGLLKYINGLHYKESDLALLSEDETAYGGAPTPTTASDILRLSFPREISQFRSEYSTEFSSSPTQDATGSAAGTASTSLRLDLAVTGSDDDSVAPYAKSQTPLSQEALMLGILSELRTRQSKFILLRATDPLDLLFLARYLRDKYPQGRLVIPTPDLLFPRDDGGQLNGVLGLNTYPLAAAKSNPMCIEGRDPLLFPSAVSAALYNASSMLVQKLDLADSEATTAVAKPVQSGVERDVSPCEGKMLPDLWLTVVSGNSIRPIKVVTFVNGSTFFPASDPSQTAESTENENEQRAGRIPLTWFFSYLGCLVGLGLHLKRSWTGGTLGQWLTARQFDPKDKPFQLKARILWFGGIPLMGIYVVLAAADTPAAREYKSLPIEILVSILLWMPLAVFAGLTAWDFRSRRGEPFLGRLVIYAAVFVSALSIYYAFHVQNLMVLWQQRALDLTSGISPVTPLVLLLLAFYCWFWSSLRGETLVDWRFPKLPESADLPEKYYRLSNNAADRIRNMISTFAGPRWITVVSFLSVVCLSVALLIGDPVYVPVRSLEGRPFDVLYSVLLGLAVIILIWTILRLVVLWREFSSMLSALDSAGFKDALQRLSGFEWKVIWNPTWRMESERYRFLSRELQIIGRLEESLGHPVESEPDKIRQLRKTISEIQVLSANLGDQVRASEGQLDSQASVAPLVDPVRRILLKLAETAGLLCKSFLDVSWKHHSKPQTGRRSVVDPCGLSSDSLALAEEFVGCIYANFLVTVLLRIRGLVFSVSVIYVCIVFSTVCYPFQPAPELSTLAIALFLFGGVVIGVVYEEMHRNATLSRMTSSQGKLDAAFWVKFASAGVVPIIALATTVYPPFGHLLNTILGPLLQAIR
jgi:hypothetical protein